MTKKEQILETALHLFATQGVGDTSTAQITKEAGVAEGTLFVHFKNKAALVEAVYVHIKKQEAEAFSKVIDKKKSAEVNVRALGKKVVEHFLKHYNELLFIQQVQQLNLISPNTIQEANSYYADIHACLKTWQKEGVVKNLDTAVLGSISWSILVSIVHYSKQHQKKVTDKMIDPVWDAIRA